MDYRESLKRRVLKRKEHLEDRLKGVLKQIENGQVGAEAERIWLDGIAKGEGIDLCAGDFIIGDAYGFDGDPRYLGCDFLMPIEDLGFFEENTFDFIVSNYIEAAPTPLETLNQAHRILKPGGVIGLSFRDADAFSDDYGALRNSRRRSTFTKKTMRHYLRRCGFKNIETSQGSDEFWARAKAYKT